VDAGPVAAPEQRADPVLDALDVRGGTASSMSRGASSGHWPSTSRRHNGVVRHM